MDVALFLIFAAVAVICGVSVVTQRQVIKSAVSLIGVMGSLAALYLLLGAEFIAATQVVIYAGAVMVLFLFVIMLLNAGTEKSTGRSWPARLFGIPLLVLLLGIISYTIQVWYPDRVRVEFGAISGGPRPIGELLFSKYVLPFEVTSVLILVAILGAVVLAGKPAPRKRTAAEPKREAAPREEKG